MDSNITINIVEPGVTPAPIDPTPVEPESESSEMAVPDTGLFSNGVGGVEATIIATSLVVVLVVVAAIIAHYKKNHNKTNNTAKIFALAKTKKKVSMPVAATLALMVSVGTLAGLIAGAGKGNTSAAGDENNLTVDISGGELTIEVGDEPVFAVAEVKATVAEAAEAGYTLTAYTEDTDLVSTTDETKIIPMVATDVDELVTLAENTYGLSLTNPESQAGEVYTALSTDASNPTFITDKDYEATEEGDETTIYYGFYITPDTPYGTYEGSQINYVAKANPELATVTFDGNGLYFDGDEAKTTNVVRYAVGVVLPETVAYSHTPNVNDEGVQVGTYGKDLNATTVYRFADNATKVHIKVVETGNDSTCGPDSNDYFTFWAGSEPTFTATANYGTAERKFGNSDGKYMFGNYNNVEADIDGVSSVTFAYTTNDSQNCSGSGYGYYAIITAQDADGNNVPVIGNNAVMGNYAEPGTVLPYQFLGWSTDKYVLTGSYTDASDFALDPSLEGGDKITVYAIWDPVIKITYNGNGADATTDMASVSQYTTDLTSAGKTVDLLASNYQREGYGFVGWSEDADAYTKLVNGEDVTIYGPNETLTIGREMQATLAQTRSLELNAVWAEAATDASGNVLTFQTDDLLNAELADGTTLASKAVGYVTALKDARDNEVYAVAKLADGNYWMIENLRLDNNHELSASNTNSPSLPLANVYGGATSNFLSATSNVWCTNHSSAECYNQSKLNTNNTALTTDSPTFTQNYTASTHADFNTNVYSYGNYYNWYSATAGNGKQETGSKVTVVGDICPTGWHLPYGYNETSEKGGNTSGGFYYLMNLIGSSSNAWRSFPNNFVYSGNWISSSVQERGNRLAYWSSTGGGSYYAYGLGVCGPSVSSGCNFTKSDGYAVRCVASAL